MLRKKKVLFFFDVRKDDVFARYAVSNDADMYRTKKPLVRTLVPPLRTGTPMSYYTYGLKTL